MENIIREIMSKVGVTQEQAKQAFEIAVAGLKEQLPKDATKHIDKLLGTKSESFFSRITTSLEQLRESIEEASGLGETKFEELRNKFQALKTEAENRIEDLKSSAKEKVEAAKEKEETDALAPETAPVIENAVETATEEVKTEVAVTEPKTENATNNLQEKGAALLGEAKEKLGDAREILEDYQEKGKEKLEEVKEFLDDQKDHLLQNIKKGALNWIDKIIPDKEKETAAEPEAKVEEVKEEVKEVVVDVKEHAKELVEEKPADSEA